MTCLQYIAAGMIGTTLLYLSYALLIRFFSQETDSYDPY